MASLASMEKMLVYLLVVAVASFHLVSLSAPSRPVNFVISEVPGSPRELQANWRTPVQPNGVVLNYTVQCNGSVVFSFDISDSISEIGSSDIEISVTLTELDPFTVYECAVSAATAGGNGNFSEASVARTTQDG